MNFGNDQVKNIIELAGVSKNVEFCGGLFISRPQTQISAIKKQISSLFPR